MAVMWTAQQDQLNDRTIRVFVGSDSGALACSEVIGLWCDSTEFREFFSGLLRRSPFEAFFWETPPVTSRNMNRPFEFVMVDAPALSKVQPDFGPFRPQFAASPSAAVLAFPNLGGDAMLVVPGCVAGETCYTHLARFLQKSPESQVHAFWQCAGAAMKKRISDAPAWLSTAGMGVSWLHLRIDSRPKYYRYQPYANPGF
jgi:hypothetical protein